MTDDFVLPKVSRFYRAQSKDMYKNAANNDEEQEVIFKYIGSYSKPYSPSYSKPLFDPISEETYDIFDFDNDFRSLYVEKEIDTPRSNVLQLSESFEKMKITGRYKPDHSLADISPAPTNGNEALYANSKANKNFTNIEEKYFEPPEFKYLRPVVEPVVHGIKSYETNGAKSYEKTGVKGYETNSYETEYETNNNKNNYIIEENNFFPNYTETNNRQVRFKQKRDTFQNQRRKSLQSVQNSYQRAIQFSPRLNTLTLSNNENLLSFSLDSYDLRDLRRRIQVNDLRKAYEEKLQNMKWRDLQNHERRNQILENIVNYEDDFFGDSSRTSRTNIDYKTNFTVDKSTQTEQEKEKIEKPLTYISKWEIVKRKMKNNEIHDEEENKNLFENKSNYSRDHTLEGKKVSININDQIYDFAGSSSTELNLGRNENSYWEIANKKISNPTTYSRNNSDVNSDVKANPDDTFSNSSKNHVTYSTVPLSARSQTSFINTEPSYDRNLIRRLSNVSNKDRRQSMHISKEQIYEREKTRYTSKEPYYERRYADHSAKNVTVAKHNNLKLDLKKETSQSFFKKFQNINKLVSKSKKHENNRLKNQNLNPTIIEKTYSHSKSEHEVNMIQHERAKNAKLYTRDITLNVVQSRKKKSSQYKS